MLCRLQESQALIQSSSPAAEAASTQVEVAATIRKEREAHSASQTTADVATALQSSNRSGLKGLAQTPMPSIAARVDIKWGEAVVVDEFVKAGSRTATNQGSSKESSSGTSKIYLTAVQAPQSHHRFY